MKREKVTAADCLSCGACCVAIHDQEAFADVTPEDEKRLGRRFVRLHVFRPTAFDRLLSAIDGGHTPPGAIRTQWRQQKNGPLRGINCCACVALRGSILSKVSCSIYENRPKVCREAVRPGDRTCLEIRKMFKRTVEEVTQRRVG